MEFIKLNEDRYMIKNSNSVIVSKEEMLKLQKKELIIKDFEGCNCQGKTTKKIQMINKELEDVKSDTIKKTAKTTRRHSKSK